MLVDVLDVPFDLEGVDRKREGEHDADVDEGHPEITREEPAGDEGFFSFVCLLFSKGNGFVFS